MKGKRFIEVIIDDNETAYVHMNASVLERIAMFSTLANNMADVLSTNTNKSRKECAEFLGNISEINAIKLNPEESARLIAEILV